MLAKRLEKGTFSWPPPSKAGAADPVAFERIGEEVTEFLDITSRRGFSNAASSAMRPVKLGAKNWLFFGSKEAGHQAAVIYTNEKNCQRHGVPVESYLRDLLTCLPATAGDEAIAALTSARTAA